MVATIGGQLIVIDDVEILAKLLRWRDTNQELVRGFNNILTEGVIEYGHQGAYRQEFRVVSEDVIRHEYLAGGILRGFGFEYSRKTWEASEITGTITFYPVHLAIQDMITIHASCMAIMEHSPQFMRRVDNTIHIHM